MERCAVQQKCCSQQQQSKSICQWHWQRTILGWQYENSNKALAYSVEWVPLLSKAERSKASASTLHTHAECMNRCRLVFFFLILQKPTHKTRLEIWEFIFRRSVLTPESHKSSNWQDRMSNWKNSSVKLGASLPSKKKKIPMTKNYESANGQNQQAALPWVACASFSHPDACAC